MIERIEGTTLRDGRFRVLEVLGRGTLGVVVEAEDRVVGDRVALKLLRPELVGDQVACERLRREVRSARQIAHPNVARVFDLFLDAGREPDRDPGENAVETPTGRSPRRSESAAFLSMERVRGETLERRLERRGRLSPDEAFPIVRQLCRGLAAAHRAGVLHRDLKPANVLLEPGAREERAVITDFGLAAGAGAAAGSLTGTGELLGSPAYMAPEHVRGDPITPAADLYALGILLYEMVTGTLPFQGETPFQTALRRLQDRPTPPTERVPGLDPRWNRVILACLDLDPENRPRSADEVLAALCHVPGIETCATPAPRPAETSAEGPARRSIRAVIGLALAGVLGTVLLSLGPAARSRGPSASAPPAEEVPTAVSARDGGSAVRAEELRDRGWELLSSGDPDGAVALLEEALWESRRVGDPVATAHSLGQLGVALERRGDRAQAERLERQALRLYRELGMGERVATQLNNLGVLLVHQGRLNEAEKLYREAAALYGEEDRPGRRAAALNNRGNLLRHLGYVDEAEALHRESLELRRRLGDARGEGVTRLSLAWVALDRGRPADAVTELERARDLFEREGHPDGVAEALAGLGEAALMSGRPDEARRLLERGVELYREIGHRAGEADCLRRLSAVALAAGDGARAEELARRSLLAFEELFDVEGRARAGLALGRVLVALDRTAEARGVLEDASRSRWVRQDASLRSDLARLLVNS